MLIQRLDDSLLEHVFSKLPASALASAQRVCKQWNSLITRAQLWEQHAVHCRPTGAASASSRGSRSSSAQQPEAYTWRDVCLDRAASAKWCAGKLSLAATLTGHTGPVTCLDIIDSTVVTGSADGTARVWDLRRGVQLHVLHMPAAAAVVAVALASVSLAVTATARNGVLLWRGATPLRRFEAMPGGRVCALALTDTQLLLGSSGGTVQHFDLFSGQQQLITRHSSGVACLSTHRQQQQQHHQHNQHQLSQPVQQAGNEWLVLIGCVDGQVSCVSCATGQVVWQLPIRHPSKVVAMQLVSWRPVVHQQQQQQDLQQFQRRGLLLYVLNARSQVICWQLPRACLDSNWLNEPVVAAAAAAAAAAPERSTPPAGRSKQTDAAGSRTGTSGRDSRSGQQTRSRQRGQGAERPEHASVRRIPLWPLSVCTVAAAAAQPMPLPASQQLPDEGQQEQQQQQQEQGRRQVLPSVHNTSTCMLSPLYGRDCLLVGSTLGEMAVVQQLQQGCGTTGVQAAAAAGDAGDAGDAADGISGQGQAREGSSSSRSNGHTSTLSATPGSRQIAASTSSAMEGADAADDASQPQLPSAATLTAPGSDPQQQQQQQPSQKAATQSVHSNGAHHPELAVVRHCSLHKLGKVLAERQAASIAAMAARTAAAGATASAARSMPAALPCNSRRSAESAVASAQQHLLDGCKAYCMQFTVDGQLVVGLGSGHVCCLKFKHPAVSVWA